MLHLKPLRSAVSRFCLLVLSAIGASAATEQFVTPVSLPVQGTATSTITYKGVLATADFNNDGRKDILALGSQGDYAILFGNGSGTLQPKDTGIPATPFDTLASADLNGDGRPDLVVVTSTLADDDGNPVGNSVVTPYLGNGDGTFRTLTPIVEPNAFAQLDLFRDLNGDRKADLIVFVSTAGNLVYLNQGNGTFGKGVLYPALSGYILGVGDFRRSGYPDLLLQNGGSVHVAFNNKGSFTAGKDIPATGQIAAIGDLNRDHYDDFVFLGSGGAVTYLGNGDGTFHASSSFSTTFSADYLPTNAIIADVNHDGNPDLLFTSQSEIPGLLSVFPGKGNGSFGYPTEYNLDGRQGVFLDYNGDGNLDLVLNSDFGFDDGAGTPNGYEVATSDHLGNFRAARTTGIHNPQVFYATLIASGDFNHDGHADVTSVTAPTCPTCTSGAVAVATGTGRGYLNAPRYYPIGLASGNIAVGDVNGDGKPDIVVARSAYYIYAYNFAAVRSAALRTGAMLSAGGVNALGAHAPQHAFAPAFAEPAVAASAQAIGDASSKTDLSVLINNGDGTFKPAMNYSMLPIRKPVDGDTFTELADVNHDGKLDLIGDWGVALGNGDGSFRTPIPLPSLPRILYMASGDFNRDGKLDLAIGTVDTANHFAIYTVPGNGDGTFRVGGQEQLPDTSYIYALTAGDMNHDGVSDLVFISDQSVNTPQGYARSLSVRLGNGNGTFQAPVTYPLQLIIADGLHLMVGDFNRDGNLDLLVPEPQHVTGKPYPTGFTTLFLGAGNGTFNPNIVNVHAAMWQGTVLDLNGDGIPDVAGVTNEGIARLLNTGTRTPSTDLPIAP